MAVTPQLRIRKSALEGIQRILEMDFTAQLSKNRHSGGPNGMIRKLYLSTMCGLNSALQIKEFKEMTVKGWISLLTAEAGKKHAYDIVNWGNG